LVRAVLFFFRVRLGAGLDLELLPAAFARGFFDAFFLVLACADAKAAYAVDCRETPGRETQIINAAI